MFLLICKVLSQIMPISVSMQLKLPVKPQHLSLCAGSREIDIIVMLTIAWSWIVCWVKILSLYCKGGIMELRFELYLGGEWVKALDA
jgi:hypothetical protein